MALELNDDGIANVYLAGNLLEAEFLRNMLADAGIEARVFGAGSVMVGMFPHEEAAPCLWVRRRGEGNARRLLAERERIHARARPDDEPPQAMWKCSACGELIEDNFDMCWNCQNARNAI